MLTISTTTIFKLAGMLSYMPSIGGVAVVTLTSTPSTPVTIYGVEPSWFSFDSANARPIDGTFELDISIVGISSDSSGSGSETTYSIGEYISDNVVYTTTITSQEQVITEIMKTPGLVETTNWTIVESAAGEWMTFSAFISSNTHELEFGQGLYQSCAFDSNGGRSASCTDVYFGPFITTIISESIAQTTLTGLDTFFTAYGGFKTALTVLTEATAVPSRTSDNSGSTPTSSSNSASYILPGCYWGLTFCFAVLVASYL
ncbi:hypothetical protein J3R30DRAFT_2425553 [Lentinula aciculospora]|uniref:Uncharacterized protein n=1 Tax=Lentinula aciculospora TaxID=153920 RepID=A0A9W9AEY5_9AGAR|nr:hypothetical protein J3R30DRAFT_2425553 [Lentinula aciculospora]